MDLSVPVEELSAAPASDSAQTSPSLLMSQPGLAWPSAASGWILTHVNTYQCDSVPVGQSKPAWGSRGSARTGATWWGSLCTIYSGWGALLPWHPSQQRMRSASHISLGSLLGFCGLSWDSGIDHLCRCKSCVLASVWHGTETAVDSTNKGLFLDGQNQRCSLLGLHMLIQKAWRTRK